MKTPPPTAKHEPQAEPDIAPPMLGAIGEEVYLLASEIAALGEELSSLCQSQMTPVLSQRLQQFDPLCQRALAQARLLRGISFLLASRISEPSGYLSALIQDVPFEQDRRRMMRALGQSSGNETHNGTNDCGELDWF